MLTEDFAEAVQGCCSYGAHVTGPDDVAHIEEMASRLTDSQWQFREVGLTQGLIQSSDDETTTLIHEDACVFLNRPGFDGDGLGCAFHHLAESQGLHHVDVMPEVCWLVPLRQVDETDQLGHVTSTIREWKRRDWGEGGEEFHWWCTESADAHVGSTMVYQNLERELTQLVGQEVFSTLVEYLEMRQSDLGTAVFLPHPAVRR